MIMPGVFFPFDCFAVWFIAACYFLCPKSIIAKKLEYVKFFLLFLSIYLLLFLILRNVLGSPQDYNLPGKSPKDLLMFLFALGFCPALCVANLVYPFKTVKRSQHLSFFLFMISLCSVGIFGLVVGVHAFSNM